MDGILRLVGRFPWSRVPRLQTPALPSSSLRLPADPGANPSPPALSRRCPRRDRSHRFERDTLSRSLALLGHPALQPWWASSGRAGAGGLSRVAVFRVTSPLLPLYQPHLGLRGKKRRGRFDGRGSRTPPSPAAQRRVTGSRYLPRRRYALPQILAANRTASCASTSTPEATTASRRERSVWPPPGRKA